MCFNVTPGNLVHLRAAGVSLVLDLRGGGLPSVVHWGADLGELDEDGLAALAAAPARTANSIDSPQPVAIVPEHSTGWFGRPGLTGHRGGRSWSARFAVESVEAGDNRVTVLARDETAELGLTIELELTPSGLLRSRAKICNHGTAPYGLSELGLALPVPAEATEILDLAGRWGRERAPQRSPFGVGARVRENRRGRTGADASILFAAGSESFGFRSGEVWALHLGWSGNHRLLRRAAALRRGGARRRRTAAAGRGRAGRGRELLHARGCTPATGAGWTRSPRRSTGTCGPGPSIRRRRGRWC